MGFFVKNEFLVKHCCSTFKGVYVGIPYHPIIINMFWAFTVFGN